MRERKRVCVLISGRGSNMDALIAACRAPCAPAEIALVISNTPDAKGLDSARANGIEAMSIDHQAFSSREAFDAALHDAMVARGIDLVACAGFMRILSAGFTAHWLGRMINIHPSLLPLYRGLDTHARALADGVRIHGCTVHFVVPELDAGPIIAQAAVPVIAGDTPDSLAARVLKAEHALYPQVLLGLAAGEIALKGDAVTYDQTGAGDETLVSPRLRAI